MRIFCILCILCFSAPTALAYPEYPPFEQTQFADDFGMFRWWQSCWWRVYDPYVYVLCEPNGDIYLVYDDGTVTRASQEDLQRLFSLDTTGGGGRGRQGARRLTPAPGDGFRLSDIYGGTFTRFNGNPLTGVFTFDGVSFPDINIPRPPVPDINIPRPTVPDIDLDGGDDDDDGRGRGGDDDDDGSNRGGDDDDGSGTRGDDPIHNKRGYFGCQSIHDSIDGGIFGPIPCTSYPGVFGPKVRFGGTH